MVGYGVEHGEHVGAGCEVVEFATEILRVAIPSGVGRRLRLRKRRLRGERHRTRVETAKVGARERHGVAVRVLRVDYAAREREGHCANAAVAVVHDVVEVVELDFVVFRDDDFAQFFVLNRAAVRVENCDGVRADGEVFEALIARGRHCRCAVEREIIRCRAARNLQRDDTAGVVAVATCDVGYGLRVAERFRLGDGVGHLLFADFAVGDCQAIRAAAYAHRADFFHFAKVKRRVVDQTIFLADIDVFFRARVIHFPLIFIATATARDGVSDCRVVGAVARYVVHHGVVHDDVVILLDVDTCLRLTAVVVHHGDDVRAGRQTAKCLGRLGVGAVIFYCAGRQTETLIVVAVVASPRAVAAARDFGHDFAGLIAVAHRRFVCRQTERKCLIYIVFIFHYGVGRAVVAKRVFHANDVGAHRVAVEGQHRAACEILAQHDVVHVDIIRTGAVGNHHVYQARLFAVAADVRRADVVCQRTFVAHGQRNDVGLTAVVVGDAHVVGAFAEAGAHVVVYIIRRSEVFRFAPLHYVRHRAARDVVHGDCAVGAARDCDVGDGAGDGDFVGRADGHFQRHDAVVRVVDVEEVVARFKVFDGECRAASEYLAASDRRAAVAVRLGSVQRAAANCECHFAVFLAKARDACGLEAYGHRFGRSADDVFFAKRTAVNAVRDGHFVSAAGQTCLVRHRRAVLVQSVARASPRVAVAARSALHRNGYRTILTFVAVYVGSHASEREWIRVVDFYF